jgi:hypothetical protein
MDAPAERISIRSSYNLTGMSFTPEILGNELKKHIPDFKLEYMDFDQRQAIANSWPKSINDTVATNDWGWKPEFNLSKMTEYMINNLRR